MVLGVGSDHRRKPRGRRVRRQRPRHGERLARLGNPPWVYFLVTPSAEFPRLTPSNHRITSPPTSAYNCIAWAAADVANWWHPGVFWPISQPKDDASVEALVEVFAVPWLCRVRGRFVRNWLRKSCFLRSFSFLHQCRPATRHRSVDEQIGPGRRSRARLARRSGG